MPEQRFDQSQSLLQQQSIAPQMQQSLQLLQTPTLELRQLVQQELVVNPTLEEESTDISLEDAGSNSEDDEFDREFAELSQLDEEWREYMTQSRVSSPKRDDADERHQFVMDSIVEPITLQDHLMNQLSFAEIPVKIREIAAILIGNIGENGFLQISLEDLCFDMGIPIQDLEAAKSLVQSFDPVGIGALDLRDCLLIQLERLGKHHSLEYRIIDHHLDDLARKRYPQIAKKLSVSPEQITKAAEFIATLDPRPGSRFGEDTNTYVTPDVTVERIGDEWLVSMNSEQIPRLRISNAYKDLMASGSGREAKAYIRDKIRAGKFLIKSIHQRQQTIQSIATEIVARQEGFLEQGPSRLKPMNMAQIAEKVGVHETTVSRAVSGKYMATPHGVYEMKYFFTTGYETEDGESLSNTSVKQTLGEMISSENPKKPYSDKCLVEELEKRGIKIARRTVAKYREEMNILPSHMRRSY
ncbi:MAG: RNA polymerase factor sigma-54 [Verrucomicrobiales bacterium]|jgi:RNA polymerase sigma-54 factor|nr:RNA polymerase factor sigma-54 [Verrucomicrobiales bacterium]MDP4792697.1 RNA polymerase factor sigma-54 [Verrucomicrobiales bacterium]MDP5006143.1 RNA polymerase factor sigma-54 [Verrucomicrobiales bacterium]